MKTQSSESVRQLLSELTMPSKKLYRMDNDTHPRKDTYVEVDDFPKTTHIDKDISIQGDSLDGYEYQSDFLPADHSFCDPLPLNLTTEVSDNRRTRHVSSSRSQKTDRSVSSKNSNIHFENEEKISKNTKKLHKTGTHSEHERQIKTRHQSGRLQDFKDFESKRRHSCDKLKNSESRSRHNSGKSTGKRNDSSSTRHNSGRKHENNDESKLPRRHSRYKYNDDLLHTADFSEFKLPRNYLNKPPVPPKSPTFSFRSTIDLLPSSRERHGLRQLVISTVSCSLAPFACGFAMAYIMTKNSQDLLSFHYGTWRMYIFLFGCVAGGFFTSVLVNFSRKVTLFLSMLGLATSWLFVIFVSMNWMLMAHQIISGVCTGIIMSVAQVYVAEVSIPKHRGAVSCGPIIAFQIGMLLCYLLGELLTWKYLAIVGICLTTPFFFSSLLCMPESPRFLIFVRPNDALATLQWIRGIESEVMEEYRDIADNYVYDRWKIDCHELVMPNFWRPLLISCGLMFLYSMCGVNSFTLYGTDLFNEILPTYKHVSRSVVTTVIIIGMTISSLLMDQIGRKLVLLLSMTIMSATAFTLGLFLFLKDLHKVESYFVYQWVGEIFCVILFTFAHGSGLGPITWVTLGEIFGPKYKWLGVSISSMMLWSSMLAADVGYHKISAIVATGGVFWFHCVICVVGYIFILILFKELKEQSIDDISKSFNKKHDKLVDTFITRGV